MVGNRPKNAEKRHKKRCKWVETTLNNINQNKNKST